MDKKAVMISNNEHKDVSIIIPAFNESNNIGNVVKKIRQLFPRFEIIVVNDGSTDDTADAALMAGAIVYSHPYNIGNGAAIKTGIRIASGEILVLMDGDGQHDPKDIGALLEYIPEFDMVVGARAHQSHASLGRSLGNRVYNKLASYVTNFKVQDLTSGFRCIKADLARQILYLLPNAYSYPTTMTLSMLRSGRPVKYVQIEVLSRRGGKSHINVLRDGARFFLIITKICTLFSPLKVFLPVSIFVFLVGVIYYLYTLIKFDRFTNMSAFLITTSVLIFLLGLVSEQICQMRFEQSER